MPGSSSSRGILRSLRTASVTAALVIALLVTTAFGFLAFGDYTRRPMESVLRRYAETLVRELPANADQAAVEAFARRNAVVVQLRHGETMLTGDPGISQSPSFTMIGVEVAVPGDGIAVLSWPALDIDRIHAMAPIVLIVLILVVLAAHHAYEARLLAPLRWLRRGVDAVAAGRFDMVLPVLDQRDELGEVSRAFNDMAFRVRAMLQSRERLLADVSHELRSPLTRIKVALEFLPESDKRRMLAEDVRAIERLIATLLERERLGQNGGVRVAEPVDLAALAEEVAAAEERPPGVRVRVEGEGVDLLGDPDLLRILLVNLVDNAIKFSQPGSRPVEIAVETHDSCGWITITDDGIGVPEGERQRIFEPFVKLDAGRGHGHGFGLGLDLCRRIAEAHGGAIALASADGGGAKVTVTLPICPPGAFL
jgi:signal transduction histidine kinase